LWRAAARDLDLIFALQWERTVNQDNTVSVQNLSLQIEAVGSRNTLAGCSVTVHQHLDGTFSLTRGPHRLGRYDAQGRALVDNKTRRERAVEEPRGGKVIKPTFGLGNPAQNAGFPLSHSPDGCWSFNSNRTF
jgi:hypothetical protein